MDYDNTVLGVENRNHPANDVEIIEFPELEEANQNTWKEKCAKWRLEEKVRNAQEILQELLAYSKIQNKVYVKNKLIEIIKILE